MNEYLVYDGGFRHPSVGKLGTWGLFVFTENSLQVFKTMTQKLKRSPGITGLVSNFLDDYDYRNEKPALVFDFTDIRKVSKFKKFLQDPGVVITMQDGEEITMFINPKKHFDEIANKIKEVNSSIEIG